ncbi:hypothetical protein C2869_16125 [Saccharobesus litoralis]|uniref:Uncharacterized protein n=1 Tax=Saccharobesus litoralis TaxID=2172099 RepID=A0A2S0VUH1_9ALTE|nr:hypothetical protein [Saccharobesus litoralis]AWB67859.1 hypothetical protein C2869_16125 [Saccharobesus litoralis]
MSIINTDAIIPFMPRVAQVRQTPAKLNITKVKKDEKSQNNLQENKKQADLNNWLLSHHDQNSNEGGSLDEANTDGEKSTTKHIDILA